MKRPTVRPGWVTLLFFLALGTAQPAHAQIGNLKWRISGGIVQPLASTGEYFKFGPSVGLDLGYPLDDRLDLKLDLDMDLLNTDAIYPTPSTNLWRYRVGLEGDLLGDQGDDLTILKAHVGAGATTYRSRKFWLESRRPYTFEGETLNQTAVTATGGLRFGLRTPDGLTWWLTGKLNWSPINDSNQEALRELARQELNPLGSALSVAITLGISL